MNASRSTPRRGGALLAVLWLSAALAAIAFSLAATVRSEIDRTSTEVDGVRAYHLATGAIERALAYIQWGAQYRNPDGSPRYYDPWTRLLRFEFPSGVATVEIIPETSKLNLNSVPPEDLLRLMAGLGIDPVRGRMIASAIVDWRSPARADGFSEFDRYYSSLNPSFRPRHASFQEVEELLLVRGVTPDLFHGWLEWNPQGRSTERLGLRDCLSVYGGAPAVDVNTAPPPVLAAVGLADREIRSVLEARAAEPFRNLDRLRALGLRPEALSRLVAGGGRVCTLRATARLRTPDGKLGDLRRTAGAMIYLGETGGQSYPVLRWHDWMWGQNERWMPENSLQ